MEGKQRRVVGEVDRSLSYYERLWNILDRKLHHAILGKAQFVTMKGIIIVGGYLIYGNYLVRTFMFSAHRA